MKLLAPTIQEAAVLTGENRERLMALCWRESWCTFAPAYEPKGDLIGWGDNNHGFGPFQIDRRYHSDFIIKELGRYHWALKFGLPYRADRQALYACGLLREAREWFGRSTTALTGDALERAVYASYNAGPARVAGALSKRAGPTDTDVVLAVDSVTTGKDYTSYIFALAKILQLQKHQWIWNQ